MNELYIIMEKSCRLYDGIVHANDNVYTGVHSSMIGGQELAAQEFLTFLMQQTLTSTTPK